jgi:hypothetical protein
VPILLGGLKELWLEIAEPHGRDE